MGIDDLPFTTDQMLSMLDERLKRNGWVAPRDPMWISASDILSHEANEEWLVRDVWPVGRQIHIHAAPKTGKSLVALWVACCLAKGVDAFDGSERPPVRIAYLDYEMTLSDVGERLSDMAFTEADLPDSHWFYALNPPLSGMDSHTGGDAVLAKLIEANVQAVIIDTFSRVVDGDENSNDTYRAFFRHTGARLKAAGIALMRLDHEGHTSGHSRGASAKADDVDIVWQLRAGDNDGFELVRKMTRIAWVPEKVTFSRNEEPLAFHRSNFIIPNGTMECVALMDERQVPLDATRRAIRVDFGIKGKNTVIGAAIRIRQNRILGL